MSQPNAPQNLTDMRLEDVPPGILYQLQQRLDVGGEKAADAGEHILVLPEEVLPTEVRVIVDAMKASPEAAFAMLKVRNGVTAIIRMAQDIHEGPGVAVTGGDNSPISSGFKENLVPSPITAEQVQPVSIRASQIPKNRLVVLAKNYYLISTAGGTFLTEIDDDLIPESTSPITEGVFARKGAYAVLTEENGQLTMQMWGNKQDSFAVADCELEVCIPADKVEGEDTCNKIMN